MRLWTPNNNKPGNRRPPPLENDPPHAFQPSAIPGRDYVECNYSQCDKLAYRDIRIVKRSMYSALDTATMLFCSEDHKRAYLSERKGVL